MYKIIGTDGRQYGPITADQVRQWIAERRANAQTLAQSEGSTEWKPLISFPEFTSEFNLAPPPASGPSGSSYNPRASNKIPAGVCAILLGSLGVHKFILGYTGAGLIVLLVTILTCGFLLPITHIIGIIEGIIYLCKSDDEFVRTYVDGRREWF
ncbi:MAG TPA: GYF domain-containing protein [Candidatus Sulfotelmatobacter sp.]|nr:GYF domain-containing protein [Candidatus Sulfotelmatobacter sp.]